MLTSAFKSMKILMCSICAIVGNCQGQYFSILIKLLNTEIVQIYNYMVEYWQNVTMVAFFLQKARCAAFLRGSCGKQSAKAPNSYIIYMHQLGIV